MSNYDSPNETIAKIKSQVGTKATRAKDLDAKVEYYRANPPFIYPGPSIRSAANSGRGDKGTHKIQRGYIRRLTEFFEKNSTSDNPSTINNLRCNFQFNPDTLTRSAFMNNNMQLFFNQDPAQLAQPIPGQAGFAFELLFNREAEVASGKYIDSSGQQKVSPNRNRGRLINTPEFYIDAQSYDPAWVTEIGVLADIMVFDDISGQGLSRDILTAVQNNSLVFTPVEDESASTSETDNTETLTPPTVKKSGFDTNRLFDFSTNLGNKAFLAPIPVRAMFTPWLMVEGFIQSVQVTFNKFSVDMIPTQAIIAVQMQAFYIGFAQQNTLLTNVVPLAPPPAGGPDDDTPTLQKDQLERLQTGVRNYLETVVIYEKEGILGGAFATSFPNLQDFVFTNTKNEQRINFKVSASKEGKAFRDAEVAKNGPGLKFLARGTIKIWWNEHVTNPVNTRLPSAVGCGVAEPAYAKGSPGKIGGADFDVWGTQSRPFVLTFNDTEVYYKQGSGQDVLFICKNPVAGTGITLGSDFIARWSRPNSLQPVPFNEDRFNVELEVILTAIQAEGTVTMELPQRIKGSYVVKANEGALFKDITTVAVLGPPAPIR